ncbi:MAG TPA: helical backbone metal receptor [Balneolales bacterium]|nr:helical backbone metal receptor [Balneolales bacterium]
MPALPYQRIISLVPSLTELLFYLGLDNHIVGRTRFCVHPATKVADVPIIGGTKNPRLDKIAQISPDLIIANKEENRKEDIAELEKNFKVYLTDIQTIEDALITIHQLGNELAVPGEAQKLVDQISTVYKERPKKPSIPTAYIIWKEPWMSIGNDTYIHDVMTHWGLTNVFEHTERYPSFELDELSEYKPRLILLSSEPYPFKEKHIDPIIRQCPEARIELIDGEWFSWYGSRMLLSFKKLNKWRSFLS